jgi:hypothetical protein
MSTKNNHINPYSASDIEKYLKGELSAREMHDLETAALDDAFLADALEGLALHPSNADDLSDLHQRLTARVDQKARRSGARLIRRRIYIAAACLLLLGIGFAFYYSSPDHKGSPKDVARNQRPSPAAAAAPADSSNISSAVADVSTIQPATTPRETALARNSPAQTSKIKAKENKGLGATTATLPPAATRLPEEDPSVVAGLQIEKDSIQSNYQNEFKRKANTYFSAADHPLVYSGKVLDAQNHPLAGASLTVNGYNAIGIKTDQKGEFRLSLRPQDSTQLLTVAMAGYTQASFTMNNLSLDRQESNIIHMQPHLNNLDEVLIVGYGNQRKETRAGIPTNDDEKLDTLWEKACPVDGRTAYLLYLAAAKNKLGLDSTITGTETVSFEIDRNGALSSFKIEQSLSPAHDAAVIRLISDGPSWRLLKGRRVRAAVSIVF